MSSARRLHGIWLGRKAYAVVQRLQDKLQEQRKQNLIGDTVLFVEHEPVITLGRGARALNVLSSREELSSRAVDLAVSARGGDVTLHAPGQLVCYPILDLAPDRCDVRRYVKDLTETMRRLVLPFGIQSGHVDEFIGLWVDAERPFDWRGAARARELAKLGAIGVHLSRWVTKHGFALNLSTNLDLYRLIVPCGISAHGVTSVAALTGMKPDVRHTAEQALQVLADVLDARGESFDTLDIGELLDAADTASVGS